MEIRILTTFISIFGLVFTTYNLKIIKCTKRNFIENLIITYLLAGVCSLKFEILMIPIYFCIMLILLFNENKDFMGNLISLLFAIIIVILSDTIQGAFFLKVLKQDLNQILNNKIIFICMHLVMLFIAYLLSSLISYILKKFKFNLKNINFKNKFFMLIFIDIILTSIIFYINAMVIKYYRGNNVIIYGDSILFMCYLFSTIIITYVMFINIENEIEFKNKKIEFKNLAEYTSNLENMYNDMRKFRHDYINILSSMVGYIEQKDLNGLEEFFNKKILLLSENISNKNYRLDKLKNISILELKGLLSSKVIRAQELGIDVVIDIIEPIEFINMDIIDLCRVTGILLDNAIEATVLCTNASIKIGIIKKQKSILILIINSCLEDTPPIYKMFEKGFSTKGNNRGMGLSNLKEIINNYKSIYFETSIENHEFIQNLQILNS